MCIRDSLNAIVKVRFDAIAHRDRELWREVIVEYLQRAEGFDSVLDATHALVHERLSTTLGAYQQQRILDAYVDTSVMATAIEAIMDNALRRYIMEPTLAKVELLASLRDQIELIVGPYLKGAMH